MISIYVATAENNVIGNKNDLPWYLPDDLKRFKQVTTGHTVIMGRKTFESIVARLGHPLPNRSNIVISRTLAPGEGYEVIGSVTEALKLVKTDEEAFVIGGAQIYETTLPSAAKIYLTRVKAKIDGDSYFPELMPSEWREMSSEKHLKNGKNEYDYEFVEMQRIGQAGQYNFSASRSRAQAENMQWLQAEGKCFMCYQNLVAYKNNRIEFETKHWVATLNAYPYDHTSLHLILVSRRHVKTMADLTSDERADLGEAIFRVEHHYKLDSYAVGMRNGDFRFNGGSVEHLHAHVIVGQRDPEKFEKVRFKMTTLPDE